MDTSLTAITSPPAARSLHDICEAARLFSPGTLGRDRGVRTHMSHLYAKLGTHRHAEVVARARALGLLAPPPHRGQAPRAG